MRERIKQIMDAEQLSPSAFADKLQIGRAVISHILNGRNNPSLDVIMRILSQLAYINPDWLLTGEGEMYKEGMTSKQPRLFAENSKSDVQSSSSNNDNTVRQFNQAVENRDVSSTDQNVLNQPVMQTNTVQATVSGPPIAIVQNASKAERKVSRIIIYYNDNTFEVFNADNKPL